MKKLMTGVLAFLMMLSVLIIPGFGVDKAKATGTVTFTVTADPTSVVSGGSDVTYSFSIQNDSGGTISDATITSTILTSAVSVGSIADGDQENATRTVSTKPSTVTFKLSYNNASGVAQTPISKTVTISQKASQPELAFERDVDKTVVSKNGTLKVTYTLQNNSDEPITSLTLTDTNLFGSVAIASGVTLAANSEQKVYTKTYTVTKDITSVPKVTYKYLGTSYSKTLDAVSIKMGSATIEVSTVSDKTTAASGDTVKFTTTLKNTGTEALSDLTLYDSDNNTIATGISLAVGETKSIDANIEMTTDKSVYFTIKGTDSQGGAISIKGNTIAITLSDPLTEGLTLTAVASSENISSGGSVTFTFTIKNTSSGVIKNISVGEVDAEEALTSSKIASLAAGATGTLTATISNLFSTTSFDFMAVGTNASGRQVEVKGNSIKITVEGTVETVTPVPTSGVGLQWGPLGTLFTVFIIIIVLIIISVIVLLVLISREKKKKKLIAAQRSKQQLQQKKPGNMNGNNNNRPKQ